MPLLVLYAFPFQGCNHDDGAGSAATAGYERWIGQVATAIGLGKAAVILEPDALAEYVRLGCLSPAEQRIRLALLHRAVVRLARLPHTAVYLDAGNSGWQPAAVMASLLTAAGVGEIRGFSLNVSNFKSTAAEESYGDTVSALLHGAHYVVDTSRNGVATASTWCNPPGQALGTPPTQQTGNPRVDALLWIKPPGASDGTCNGGPPARTFWLPYALGLAAKAHW
jgi:endoglucanase